MMTLTFYETFCIAFLSFHLNESDIVCNYVSVSHGRNLFRENSEVEFILIFFQYSLINKTVVL